VLKRPTRSFPGESGNRSDLGCTVRCGSLGSLLVSGAEASGGDLG
jgi:hypothetical protein